MIDYVKVDFRCDIPGCRTAWDVANKPVVYAFSNLPHGERGIKICEKCLSEMAKALKPPKNAPKSAASKKR